MSPLLFIMLVALVALCAEVGNIIFSKATLFIDPDGENIELAELQNLSFETRDTMKTAPSKDVWPLAKRLAERNLTVRAQWMRCQAQGLAKINGGAVTYADDKTTISVIGSSAPTAFKMKMSNPSDGSEVELILYNCLPLNFTFPMALKEFTMPSAEFEISQDDAGKVYDIILPGYQSVN